jgi:16S rRNA pseudouridine516 synthase
MSISRGRLDRFISQHCQIKRRDVRLMIAQRRIKVDGINASSVDQAIHKFSNIVLDDQCLQNNYPCYVMLHKPIGVVSATKDRQHTTVIDLLTKCSSRFEHLPCLHIVGRLDLNTSGLLLLTDDSRWSKVITEPKSKVAKRYQVTLKNQVRFDQQKDYITAFQQGMYFPFEGITTQPAKLIFLSETMAVVTLFEGRYHQIKRMFGRFRNPVIALHRFAIGNCFLPEKLVVGNGQLLSVEQAHSII